MPLPTFVLGGTTLTFHHYPARPGRQLGFVQPEMRSAGSVRLGRDYYTKRDLIPLDWPHLSGSDKDNLIAFFRDTARGMANTFTYNDAAGTAYTAVRFASPTLDIREIAYDTYAVKLTLRYFF